MLPAWMTTFRNGDIAGGVDEYRVVAEKSTVSVYTSQWIRTIIMRNGADPSLFHVASNPEFLREGTAVTDFSIPTASLWGSSVAVGKTPSRKIRKK